MTSLFYKFFRHFSTLCVPAQAVSRPVASRPVRSMCYRTLLGYILCKSKHSTPVVQELNSNSGLRIYFYIDSDIFILLNFRRTPLPCSIEITRYGIDYKIKTETGIGYCWPAAPAI